MCARGCDNTKQIIPTLTTPTILLNSKMLIFLTTLFVFVALTYLLHQGFLEISEWHPSYHWVAFVVPVVYGPLLVTVIHYFF